MAPLGPSFHPFCEASIQLYPTGHATEDGQPIFMSSSIIRGNVNLMMHEPRHCHSLRIIFHASESLPLRVIGSAISQSRFQQFFGTQKVLLTSQDLYPGQHDFGFAFQLPRIQYPPTMEHALSLYACRFKLTLYVDKDVMATKEIVYRPLIETRLLHTPLVKAFRVAKTCYSAKLHALDYIPGDTIFLGLKPHGNGDDDVPTTLLLLQVVQIASLLSQPDADKIAPLVTVVASSTNHDRVSPRGTDYRDVMALRLPHSLPPSFSYGKVITINYRLRLVKRTPKSGLWSAIKGGDGILLDIPITIGTVSYDVHASTSDLQVYTVFSNVFKSPGSRSSVSSEQSVSSSSTSSFPEMPVPRSIPVMSTQPHYDDSDELPPYSMLKLPGYDEVMGLQQEGYIPSSSSSVPMN
ncbi:hypothetical protein BJV82DRAFT_580212 [Fennellomyces sp. T-0311]|nr:hypothetical protein BJV82DRAFT_580212 [Fennellomyces sp. T-0311]